MATLRCALFACLCLTAYSKPLPPPVTTESGSGIAPWAGQGPVPDPQSSTNRVSPQSQAAARSNVPVGTIITRCTQPGTVALTFDDGPYIYTSQILNTLKSNGMPATFFVNGDNWANILSDSSKALVRRMLAEGHQIGSHTWSHPDLATLDRAGIVTQMNQLKDALLQITGKYPAYMRPPYFSTNNLVLQTMGELGYHVINADIDTLDWANDSQQGIQTSVQRFKDGLNQGGTIELSHDVHQWTANTLVPAMISEIKKRGLKAVTVGACLGDPAQYWYRTA